MNSTLAILALVRTKQYTQMKTTTIKLFCAALCFTIMLNACKKSEDKSALATLTTADFTDVTTISAVTGGNITNDGGAAVVNRGVCYALHQYPSITDSITLDGGGTGQFSSALLKLTPGTVYYVRAYANNAAGTAYGQQLTLLTLPIAVGDSYGGGIVAYVLKSTDAGFDYDKEHGIICSANDLTAVAWGNAGNAHATATAINSGSTNTENIILNLGTGTYAARECYDLSLNTYSDWYLPSIYELNELYLQKDIIGGFTSGDYWSSSEVSNNTAWVYEMATGSYYALDKSTVKNVRAIRSF